MLPSSDNFHQKYVKWNFKSSASTVFFFFEEAQVFGRHKTETGGEGRGKKAQN